MKIGELIQRLKMAEKQDAEVWFDFAGCVPTTVDSWRGIYAEPALGWKPTGYSVTPHDHGNSITVAMLIAELEGCIGREYTGWKGGEYTYTKGDTLHIDNPGDCTHTELSRVEDLGYAVILHTLYQR